MYVRIFIYAYVIVCNKYFVYFVNLISVEIIRKFSIYTMSAFTYL